MNHLIKYISTVALLIINLNGLALAKDTQTWSESLNKNQLKISSSISNIFTVGDLNLKLEKKLKDTTSLITTIHY